MIYVPPALRRSYLKGAAVGFLFAFVVVFYAIVAAWVLWAVLV